MNGTFYKFSIIIGIFLFTSCGNDDERTCTSCRSDQTPEFTICQESNGNASINGQDTGTEYDIYLNGLVEAGADCGG